MRQLLDVRDWPVVAGTKLVIPGVWRMFQLISSPADLQVTFFRNKSMIGFAEVAPPSFKFSPPDGDDFHSVTLESAIDQTVRIAFCQGDVNLNVLAGSLQSTVTKATVYEGVTDVTLAAGAATLLLAADADRREALVTKITGADMRVGGSNVLANRGTPVRAGETITITGTAAIYGFCAAAEGVAISVIKD